MQNAKKNFFHVSYPLKNIYSMVQKMLDISKTIQNEILGIAADQIQEFYRRCLRKSPHFSIMADEVTSHGKEILAVCVRFLEVDHSDFQTKPHKHKVTRIFILLIKPVHTHASTKLQTACKPVRLDSLCKMYIHT